VAKRLLMTPGPTPVPPEVFAAMSEPMVHHRTRAFRETLARLLARLREVHRTERDVLVFASTGTGAMEGAVSNLLSPGDRALVVSAGNFGERWVGLCEAYGADVVPVRLEWGEVPAADDVASALADAGGARAVFLTHSETSTGVVADVDAIGRSLADSGALVVVDAISSLGACPLSFDASGLDVVVSGSQKALMTPPGLATTALSERAVAAAEESRSPRFYFDWRKSLKQAREDPPSTPFTTGVSLVLGLDKALELILAEGLEAAWERHVRLGRACRAGVRAMGLDLFSPDDDRSSVVTAIRMPEGMDGAEVIARVRERHGMTLEGGRGPLVGKIVRIGHVGYVDVFDVIAALAAVEQAVAELGGDVERGNAAAAALEAYGADPVPA
jgi:aspartate aminotransferase-like enzyme